MSVPHCRNLVQKFHNHALIKQSRNTIVCMTTVNFNLTHEQATTVLHWLHITSWTHFCRHCQSGPLPIPHSKCQRRERSLHGFTSAVSVADMSGPEWVALEWWCMIYVTKSQTKDDNAAFWCMQLHDIPSHINDQICRTQVEYQLLSSHPHLTFGTCSKLLSVNPITLQNVHEFKTWNLFCCYSMKTELLDTRVQNHCMTRLHHLGSFLRQQTAFWCHVKHDRRSHHSLWKSSSIVLHIQRILCFHAQQNRARPLCLWYSYPKALYDWYRLLWLQIAHVKLYAMAKGARGWYSSPLLVHNQISSFCSFLTLRSKKEPNERSCYSHCMSKCYHLGSLLALIIVFCHQAHHE